MRKRSYVVCLSCVLVCFFGCKRDQRAQPPPPADSSPPPQLEPSTIYAPIEVSLALLSEQVAAKMPVVLQEKDWEGRPENVKYKITRGSLQLSMEGPVLNLGLPIHCEAEWKRQGQGRQRRGFFARRGGRRDGSASGFSCQTSVALHFSSILHLTPDWRLITQTRPGKHTWTEPCEVTPLRINLVDLVDQRVVGPKLKEVAKTIDQRVAERADFGDRARQAWDSLQEPIKLGQEDFWLLLQPEQISLSPLEGQGQSVHATLGIIAQPQLVLSQTRPTVEKKPLPNNNARVSEAAFHIALEADLLFEEASEKIRQRVEGRNFAVAGQAVSIEDVHISGNGNMFVLKVRVGGALVATIYLTGVPKYDLDSGELLVENLDFSVETRNLLAKMADWFLHGTFQEKMAERARFSLAEQLEKAKGRLQQGLNRQINPKARLTGNVEQLTPRGVYVTPTSFKAIVVADGQVSLLIQ